MFHGIKLPRNYYSHNGFISPFSANITASCTWKSPQKTHLELDWCTFLRKKTKCLTYEYDHSNRRLKVESALLCLSSTKAISASDIVLHTTPKKIAQILSFKAGITGKYCDQHFCIVRASVSAAFTEAFQPEHCSTM